MSLEGGEISIRRLGRFQKVKLCDSFSVETMRVHLDDRWMYMETFSIKDYCKNDITKNFERIVYIQGESLKHRMKQVLASNCQMRLT